jgi:para-aminobenzoate synthetase component 1
MISRVTGQLLPDTSLPDILRALFPCGSITGAPKIRAMEIIRALEPCPRGVYCGAIGWAGPDGRAEFNVAIRTLSLFDDGEVVLNVGGGIVHDSTAEGEYEEALWKARFTRLS